MAGHKSLELFDKTEWLWTVDEYCNRMAKRKAKHVRKDQEIAAKYQRTMNIFGSESEAVDFMLERASKEVRKAEDDLREVKGRLDRLRKKYTV